MNRSNLLQEMGIDEYLVRESGYYADNALNNITPPSQCRLLLVVNDEPSATDIEFLGKILSTLPLTTEQAQWVWEDDFAQVDLSMVEWVWFCGTAAKNVDNIKCLTSSPLSEVMSNTEHKRALWSQIKAQKANS